jgi:hypothetical protein
MVQIPSSLASREPQHRSGSGMVLPSPTSLQRSPTRGYPRVIGWVWSTGLNHQISVISNFISIIGTNVHFPPSEYLLTLVLKKKLFCVRTWRKMHKGMLCWTHSLNSTASNMRSATLARAMESGRQTRVRMLVLPHTGCVTLGKSFNLLET